MYNSFRKRSQNGELPRIRLDGIWQVEADRDYQISPKKKWPSGFCVAVRTEKGRGILETVDGTCHTLQENSLIFLDPTQVLRYRTQENYWRFSWFEFFGAIPEAVRRGAVFYLPFSAMERELTLQCYQNLASSRQEACLLAQAAFLQLFLSWLAQLQGMALGGQQNLISALESGGRRNLSIPEIAQEAGMSERSFRSAVRKRTGYSPAEYLIKMKMDTAMEILTTTDQTLQEIADRLNLGSPFYFSRSFKQYFGITPSQARSAFSDPDSRK